MSWREILGLVMVLVICFGIVSYALTNASQNRETASSEQTGKAQKQGANQQPATTPSSSSSEDKETLTIRVSGSTGEQFSGQFSTLDASRPVTGSVPVDYKIEARTDPRLADFVFVTVAKIANNNHQLSLQILENGRALKSGSTTEPYGVVSLTWSPNEPTTPERTTTDRQRGY
ncbi:MAG: hypothetical protein JOZ19_05835 [Rubrobacter sp.]|nr:hypothetical protein [Rubrobacter sp.]